jgi:hypothetical protein
VRKKIPDEELLADLRKVADANGGKVSIKIYTANGKFSPFTIVARFGSWNNALDITGLEHFHKGRLPISDEALFTNFKEIWLKIGRRPKFDDFKPPLSQFSGKTYLNRFGSWPMIVEKFYEVVNADSKRSIPFKQK